MKKSLCVFLCVLFLFGSIAIVCMAEPTEPTTNAHGNFCECPDCAGTKDASDLTYVGPDTDENTTISGRDIDSLISEKFGDELVEAGKDADEKINLFGELMEKIRSFFQRLAEALASLSDPIKNLIKR